MSFQFTFVDLEDNSLFERLTKAYTRASGALKAFEVAQVNSYQDSCKLQQCKGLRESAREISRRMDAALLAAVREQAAALSLSNAIECLQIVLIDFHSAPHQAWPRWLFDIYRINLICAVKLLQSAINSFDSIQPFDSDNLSLTLDEEFTRASNKLTGIPSLTVLNNADRRFLVHCLAEGAKNRGETFEMEVPDSNHGISVDTVCALLEKSHWRIKKHLVEKRMTLQLIPPADFRIR